MRIPVIFVVYFCIFTEVTICHGGCALWLLLLPHELGAIFRTVTSVTCSIPGVSCPGDHSLCFGSVCALQQALRPTLLLHLKGAREAGCGQFWALVQQVCECGQCLVPVFKSSFPACLNQTFPKSSLLETRGYCHTRGCVRCKMNSLSPHSDPVISFDARLYFHCHKGPNPCLQY